MSNLNVVIDGYVYALFLSRDFELDGSFTEDAELAFETVEKIWKDCRKFLETGDPEVTEFLAQLSNDDLRNAGIDIYLTRRMHGAGFWDGDWEDPPGIGYKLTMRAHALGDMELYIGDDGLIYSL